MVSETRQRSFWAWGWADRFPDEPGRRNLGRMVGAFLGDPGAVSSDPQAPPSLAEVRVPEPRLAVPDQLAAFTTDDRTARVMHTYGRSYPDQLRGFRGDFAPAPDLVATPRDESDVVSALRWASAAGAAVVPYGGGTGVVGGVEAGRDSRYAGVVSLDLRRLDAMLELDTLSRHARIQAGATGPQVEAHLAPHGLTLRHFPQSFEFSTLGGWVATRAGGHFATLYTHIDDLVAGIRTVTPSGVLESRRLPGSGAGPSPDRMILGSEGALGVIVDAWVRVRPRPRHRAAATVQFDDYSAAVAATRAVAQADLYPTNCRLLDKREAMLNGLPVQNRHVLILAFESDDHPLEAWIQRALDIALSHGGVCPEGFRLRLDERAPAAEHPADPAGDAGAADKWRRAFIDAPYLQSALISLGVIVDTFETACTWDAFEGLHAAVIRRVRAAMKEQAGAGLITCRFTHVYPDGPAPYFTWFAPARRGHELEQWAAIKAAASEALIEHGATITHHHAVGRTHRPWYDRQRPDAFARALAAQKRELDPAWILNPGVLIDEPSSRPG